MALGGGSPQTFSQGGNPKPYVPQAQAGMDQLFQNTLNQFPWMPSNTPAGQFYPQAQYFYSYASPLGIGGAASNNAIHNAWNIANNYAGPTQSSLESAGNSVLNTAFDPQQALYQRQLQQTLDQSNVANSMAGIAGTPYGASNVANQARNFNVDWQNNLLNREIAGGQSGTSLLSAAPQIGQSLASLPYTTLAGIGNNATGALGNMLNIGNQQYAIPQQVLNDVQSYLGLGQAASGLALDAGNLGFNQTAQGLGGLLSGANMLFGGGGGGGLFGGGSSLLGGGSSLAADSLAPTTFATDTNFPISDIAGGGGGGLFSSISGP